MSDPNLALIVDDDEELRALFSMSVGKMGFKTFTLENTVLARRWLSTHVPSIILLDIMMPDGNGLDLCRWIRSETRLAGVPVLMTSALKDEETAQDALELGAVDFLRKPFTMATLKEKIEKLKK